MRRLILCASMTKVSGVSLDTVFTRGGGGTTHIIRDVCRVPGQAPEPLGADVVTAVEQLGGLVRRQVS